MRGVILAGATLLVIAALAACGGDQTPGGNTGNGGGTGNGGDGGSNSTAYAVKTDLCADADFGPLKAVLPAVTNLEAEKLDRDLGTLYTCDGNAGKSEAYNDIGFITLVAYFYDTIESANIAHERNANPSLMQDIQQLSGLGERAVSFVDGRSVGVSVQDGTFHFTADWSPNGVDVPAGVREALVETTRATLAKLKAA
jgi:hypothetical protein